MNKLMLLRNVGDGMNLLVDNNQREDLTIDYGGDENVNNYGYFQGCFILSHFHADHYNGILSCNRDWYLNRFYYPCMPRFPEADKFSIAMLAMNIRVSKNHPIQSTVLTAVRQLNRNAVVFKSLVKGEVFMCGGKRYEILWPPEELNEKYILSDIRKAINDFDAAIQVDPVLREIYQSLERKYESSNPYDIDRDKNSENWVGELSMENFEAINKANISLRKAANRLSLVFRQEDNLLFLGDLESSEIKTVINDLVSEGKTYYDVLIAAHHGTHWHDKLNSIECRICLVSIGKTLQKHIKYEYKGISKKLIRTDELGDIYIKKSMKVRIY